MLQTTMPYIIDIGNVFVRPHTIYTKDMVPFLACFDTTLYPIININIFFIFIYIFLMTFSENKT